MDYKREFDSLIELVAKEGASDLHLTVGRHPTIRVSGDLIPIVKKPPLTPEDVLGLVSEILTPENKELFLKNKDLDFAFTTPDGARFRGNLFYQRGFVGAAFRLITAKIRTLEELNLPPALADFARRKQGFFLVVGP